MPLQELTPLPRSVQGLFLARLPGAWLATTAVAFFSTSAVLVLWAAPLGAFEITVGRLSIAAALAASLAVVSGQPIFAARPDWLRFVGYGFITALHFLCYIASLRFTTIAHSLSIVYTAPVFVALFSAWFLHEPIAPRRWLGVAVTVIGIAVLAGFEPRLDSRMIWGDLLALGSALTFGLYSVAGRSQRTRYGLFTYTGTVYALSALWALPVAVFTFNPAGYQPKSLLALLGAGLLPLGAGHTLYNASLRRTHATTANLIATQEVTGGILLGALFMGQIPHLNEIAGAVIALAGIVLILI